mmetsp:Transcript_8100/g.19759  ORF Transcript_8100/g.19759 Transcript_8100/m.19759 type:complete len:284 (+) Transcript_8100:266-1117(+)
MHRWTLVLAWSLHSAVLCWCSALSTWRHGSRGVSRSLSPHRRSRISAGCQVICANAYLVPPPRAASVGQRCPAVPVRSPRPLRCHVDVRCTAATSDASPELAHLPRQISITHQCSSPRCGGTGNDMCMVDEGRASRNVCLAAGWLTNNLNTAKEDLRGAVGGTLPAVVRARPAANHSARGQGWMNGGMPGMVPRLWPGHAGTGASSLAQFGSLEGVLVCHDAQELLLVHLPVAVEVSLVDHLLQLLVRHVLAELARNTLKIFEGDVPCLIVVEELKHPHDFLG